MFEKLAEREKKVGPRRQVSSLSQLRSMSARRMWNITNQLNVLYEANWTSLVVDELAEFERQLVEALASLDDQPDEQQEWQDEQAGKEQNELDKKSKQREAKQNKPIKSWRKSLVHSLATITTMG